MSESPNTPKPAILAASTTNDVIRAMADDPGLRGAVLQSFDGLTTEGKSLLASKSFWMNILTPLATLLISKYAVHLDDATTSVLVGAAAAGMATLMRTISTGKITSVLPTAAPIIFTLAALILVGCGTNATPMKSDVDLVADVVRIELPIILPSLSPDQQAKATTYAAQVETARQAIDAGAASGGTVNAQTLVMALQGLAPLVAAGLPPSSPAAIAVASAVALAPVILARFGTVGAARIAVSQVDVERSRMVLRGVR